MLSLEQDLLTSLNTLPLASAALAYARLGLPVFPLVPGEKYPLVANGFYSATTDPQIITRWWQKRPTANIGIPCGKPSGWWVIDIDPRHDGFASLTRLHRDIEQDGAAASPLYATRRQLTGGDGAHLFFQRRTHLGVEMHSTAHFAGYHGIDYKGDRSYVVVAPSVHPSGRRYQWLNDQPLAPFPDALIARWVAHRRQAFTKRVRYRSATSEHASQAHQHSVRTNDPLFYLRHALSQAYVGQRNRFACYLACRLVENVGLAWGQAVPWMLEYVSCVPQHDHAYTEEEALRALDWAIKQAQAA